MSTRNRTAGNSWELTCLHALEDIGYKNLATSRNCSRVRDAAKVDLCHTDESPIEDGGFGRFEFNFQCKTLCKPAPYGKLLKELEEHNGRRQFNVVLHKQTEKNSSGRFMPKGEYAILNLDDFYKIIGERRNYTLGYKLLMEYFDSIPDSFKEEVDEQLKELGI